MLIKEQLVLLIKSLTKSEKRNFRLHCKKQIVNRYYLDLFDIINETKVQFDIKDIQSKFKKKYPNISTDNTAKYLLDVIVDSLVNLRVSYDGSFAQYQHIMRSQILIERSINQEGLKELKKAQKLSRESEDSLIYYLTSRKELNLISQSLFEGKEFDELIKLQMNLKNTLQHTLKIQDLYSILEVMQFRFLHKKRSFSVDEKKKLNDLILSEISLVTSGLKQSFEPQKLHLMFQAFFLVQIGNYNPALKAFKELISLFEKNSSLWSNPPFDYLFTLEGILDNLRSIGLFHEMNPYILSIEELNIKKYPAYFQNYAQTVSSIFRLAIFLNENQLKEAVQLSERIVPSEMTNYNSFHFEKLLELKLYSGLVYYKLQQWKKVNQIFNQILILGKAVRNSIIYRACRIIYLIIKYEQHDDTYQFELRSHKRFIRKTGASSKLEKLIQKVIRFDPVRKNKKQCFLKWKNVEVEFEEIENNLFEREILKYFDFKEWVKKHLLRKSVKIEDASSYS